MGQNHFPRGKCKCAVTLNIQGVSLKPLWAKIPWEKTQGGKEYPAYK